MKSPFKFLDSYTKEDREMFFGREREIEELYHRVFESKIMLVYGVSGTGKSSLIHCGLANKFQETDWLPLNIRRGSNIIDSFSSVIRNSSLTSQPGEIVTPGQFKKAVRSLYLDHYKPIFFILDQFEELFIFGSKEEKRPFIQIIKSVVESDIQCRFLFVMREEYMASISEFERFIPTIFSNRVRIEKMSHLNAIEAIKGPCKVAGIELEEGFAEALLEKLSPGSTDVELTYLQVFLDRILRSAGRDLPPSHGGQGEASSPIREAPIADIAITFTTSLLSQTGNVSDILGSFLDEQISLLDNPETGLQVLKSFVSVKGTKQPMSLGDVGEFILTLGARIDEKQTFDLINSFVQLRILCDKDQNEMYELRHDALAAKIYEKFTLAEKELIEVRKFVENAYYTFEKRGLLLNKQDLDYLKSYQKRLILPKNLEDFVDQSDKKINIQKKYLVRITSISAVIIILLLASMIRFYFRSSQNTQSYQEIGASLLQSGPNPVKGLISALNLWEKDSSLVLIYDVILNNFVNIYSTKTDSSNPIAKVQKELSPVILESGILSAEISKNGVFIFGRLDNSKIFILDIKTGIVKYIRVRNNIEHIELSEKDSCIALIYKDNSCELCDFNGTILFHFETRLNSLTNNCLVSFFPTGEMKLAVALKNSIIILNRQGKVIQELKNHFANINSVEISSDGRFLASASDDKTIMIWKSDTEKNRFSLYNTLSGHLNSVWSVHFNKSSKYVISASADSTIRIWDLMGKEINPSFNFAKGFYSGSRSKQNKREPDPDESNPVFKMYYTRFCNAIFSEAEREIIATGYSMLSDSKQRDSISTGEVLFYDDFSTFKSNNFNSYLQFSHLDPGMLLPVKYYKIAISVSGRFAACVNEKDGKITLCSAGGLRLITIDGSNPIFLKSEDDIYWTKDNEIRFMPMSPEKIQKLLDKYQVKGTIPKDDSKFVIF
jgi:WD40 repeat protein